MQNIYAIMIAPKTLKKQEKDKLVEKYTGTSPKLLLFIFWKSSVHTAKLFNKS